MNLDKNLSLDVAEGFIRNGDYYSKKFTHENKMLEHYAFHKFNFGKYEIEVI